MKKYFIAITIMALSHISMQAQYIQGPAGPVEPNSTEEYWFHGTLNDPIWDVMGGTILDEYIDAGYYYVVIEWGSVSPGRIFLYDGNTYIAQKTVEICSNFIEVAIDSILFCYGSSVSLDIRKDADENIPLPEFIAGERNEPFAYIKSQQDRKIKVKFSSEDATTMTLIVDIRCITGVGPGEAVYKNLGQVNISNYIEITLSDADVPNTIGKRTYTWEWKVYAIPVGSGCSYMSTFTTQHTYYTLLATPQAPMSEPWTDVLDYACVWASGATSAPIVISSLTADLYESGIEYTAVNEYTNQYNELDLTDLLTDIQNLSAMAMNCADFSNFLHVLSNALGLNSEYAIIDNEINRLLYGFDIKHVLPADWINPRTNGFSFHQVVWYDNAVADASLKVDKDYDNQVWDLALGDITLSTYLYYLVDDSDLDDVNIVEDGTCGIVDF